MAKKPEKILNTKDVFIMSVAANLGPRWIAVAAALGLVSLFYWLIGAVFFLLPFTLIVIELSTKYPGEGGIYIWVKKHLGSGPSFVAAWCYWINNFFFYPAILSLFITVTSYAFGFSDLANNQFFVVCLVLFAFWTITALIISGMKVSKIFSSIGGLVSCLICISLTVLGILLFITSGNTKTPLSLTSLFPQDVSLETLSSISLIMFALSGVEIIPTFANVIQHPEKTLPKALTYFIFFIFIIYALATFSMITLIHPNEIKVTTGLITAFELLGSAYHIPYLAQGVSILFACSELGALMLWVLAPAVMFFKDTPKGILPDFVHQENKRGIPVNALLIQGVLVSIITMSTYFLPSVNDMYQVLILMTAILFFIPYFLVLLSFIRMKLADQHGPYTVPGGKIGAFLLCASVFISLLFAIFLSFFPGESLVLQHKILSYELELIVGTIGMLCLGIGLYYFRKTKII